MTFPESKENIRGWLTLKMRTGRFSERLLKELASHNISRTVNVHAVLDEIGYLEVPRSRRAGTKPAKFLRGL
jgi:hypothetical protein